MFLVALELRIIVYSLLSTGIAFCHGDSVVFVDLVKLVWIVVLIVHFLFQIAAVLSLPFAPYNFAIADDD